MTSFCRGGTSTCDDCRGSCGIEEYEATKPGGVMGGQGNGERDNALRDFRGVGSPVDLCICGPKTRGEHGCLCSEPYAEKGHFEPKADHSADSFYFFETLLDECHPSSRMFYDHLLEAALLHKQKQADYGKTDDPFSNVRASEEWGIPGWIGACVRLNDKVRRLQTLATKGELANEAVKDSFLDIAVYSLIALVLYEQDPPKG